MARNWCCPFIPGPHIRGNCVFDVHGNFVLQQATDGSGKNGYDPASFERDELGWPTTLVSRVGEGKMVALTKFRNGPFGPIETEEWVRGKLVDKEINTYDDRGNQLTSDTYDGCGNLVMGDAWRTGLTVVENLPEKGWIGGNYPADEIGNRLITELSMRIVGVCFLAQPAGRAPERIAQDFPAIASPLGAMPCAIRYGPSPACAPIRGGRKCSARRRDRNFHAGGFRCVRR